MNYTRKRKERKMNRTFNESCAIILAFLLASALLDPWVPVCAQTSSGKVSAGIELTRSVIQTQRDAIVGANLDLNEQEAAEFWPLYRKYRTAVAQVDDRAVILIKDYAAHYNSRTVSNEIAKVLLKEYLSIEKKRLKLKKRYVRKFRGMLPDTKVMRYFQIENKMDAVVEYDMAGAIPLVK
jgi:hypothetical protein